MNTADWMSITSVKVQLSFTNPLFGQPGQTAQAQRTINFVRIVNVMSRAGVTT